MDVDITMMMQLNRLPELSSHYELPEFEYSGGSVASIEATAPPFSQTLVQEPFTLAPSINFSPKFDTNNLIDLAGAKVLQKRNSMEAMREMIFRIAVMQPIHIDPESVKPPKRRNVKISKDPQSVAARQRRERISERIRILQRLVPGGTKMDTASMLDEAIHYVKFLKKQVQSLEKAGVSRPIGAVGFPTATMMGNLSYSSVAKGCQPFYQTDGGLYMNA